MSSFDPEYVRKQYLVNINQSNPQQLVNSGNGQQNQNNLNGEILNSNQQSENQSPIINANQNGLKQNDLEDKQQDQPLFIPRFLEKFSNTFFRKTDPKMNPNDYYQQKQQEWEQKQEEKKQKQQLKKTTTKQTNQVIESQKNQDTKQIANSKRIANDKHGRSVSSIVFDYNNFSQSSSSKFGFANELLTSLKQGANNILMNIKGSIHLSSQQIMELDRINSTNQNKQDDLMLIPNTESDELNTIQSRGNSKNTGVIEFETEESERQQIKHNKKNKEQHVSIIDNPNSIQRDNGQQNGSIGNKQQLGVYFSGNSNKKNEGSTNNQQIFYTDQQDENKQQNNIQLIKEQSDYDEEGQLNTIIEEKSILDHTNNNNIINFLNNQQNELPKGQKMRNLSQYNIHNENIQQQLSKSPKNFLYEKNPNKKNQQGFNDLQQNNDEIEFNDNYNPNQHRRFLSAQLTHQINFNRQPSISQNQESPKKHPLQAFEEENSIMNESQQSQSKQDQSSIMSCSRMDKSSNTCLVCFDKQPDSVFMDCGHGGVCYECALEIWKKTAECYLCRLKIVQVLQVDLKSKVYGLIKVISSTQMVQREVDESEMSSQNQHLEEIEEDNQE